MVSLFDKENKMKNNCNKVSVLPWFYQCFTSNVIMTYISIKFCSILIANVDESSRVPKENQEVALLWSIKSKQDDVSTFS